MNKYSCQIAVWWVHWCSARTRCSCHRNSGGSSSPCPGNGSSSDTLSWLHNWVMKQIIICIRIHVRPHLSWHALVSLVTMYPTRLTSARGQADSWNTSHGCWAAQWPATPSSKATIKHVAGDVISSLCDFLLKGVVTWMMLPTKRENMGFKVRYKFEMNEVCLLQGSVVYTPFYQTFRDKDKILLIWIIETLQWSFLYSTFQA